MAQVGTRPRCFVSFYFCTTWVAQRSEVVIFFKILPVGSVCLCVCL